MVLHHSPESDVRNKSDLMALLPLNHDPVLNFTSNNETDYYKLSWKMNTMLKWFYKKNITSFQKDFLIWWNVTKFLTHMQPFKILKNYVLFLKSQPWWSQQITDQTGDHNRKQTKLVITTDSISSRWFQYITYNNRLLVITIDLTDNRLPWWLQKITDHLWVITTDCRPSSFVIMIGDHNI